MNIDIKNGRPVGYITLRSIIYPLKLRVRRLWRLFYCQLAIAMLAGPLMDFKDPGKVRNWRVAHSRIVLLILLLLIITNVDKTLILTRPRKKMAAPLDTLRFYRLYMSPPERGVSRLWRLIYALLSMAMLVGPLMDVMDSGKVRNRLVAKSQIVLIINVDKTLILALPRKQNGRPIGNITRLSFISPVKRSVRP